MAFNVEYSFNNGETTGTATTASALKTAISNVKSTLTQCTLSGTAEGDLSSLFYNCTSLESLDLSSFDTSNVTNMSYMFYNCSSLTSLDLSNFDTSKVTNMYSMFGSCKALSELDLSSFDTSNVTNMGEMFSNCGSSMGMD